MKNTFALIFAGFLVFAGLWAAPRAAITQGETETPEAEPKILGAVITRADGTFLGLEVVAGNFKLSFYDAEKKAIAPNVSQARATWPNPRGQGNLRTMLNLSENALVGAKPVLPSYTYDVRWCSCRALGNNSKSSNLLWCHLGAERAQI